MIYLFPKIYKSNTHYLIRKKAWNTLDNHNAHNRGLCQWRRVTPICKYVWKSSANAEEYSIWRGKNEWFLDWKDVKYFNLVGRI